MITSTAGLDVRFSSWAQARAGGVDVVIAAALMATCLSWGLFVRAGVEYAVLSVALIAPLVVRRSRPAACLVAVCLAALLQWLTVRGDIAAHPADVAVPIAVHAAAAYGPAWARGLGLAAGLAGAVLGGISWPLLASSTTLHVLVGAFFASTIVAAWTAGVLQRARHALAAAERRQRAELAVLAERRRIARDMHDVVAHALAGVIAQSDGARYAGTPEAGAAALEAIGRHARAALTETRRVLGVLRDGPGELPGPADLDALVRTARADGLDVRAAMDLPDGLEPGMAMTVHRIVQEGLTNVLKHAGPTGVEVTVAGGDTLVVEVRDAGGRPSSPAAPSGFGLIGMRERVAVYGGTVELTPLPGGGHLLRAELPR